MQECSFFICMMYRFRQSLSMVIGPKNIGGDFFKKAAASPSVCRAAYMITSSSDLFKYRISKEIKRLVGVLQLTLSEQVLWGPTAKRWKWKSPLSCWFHANCFHCYCISISSLQSAFSERSALQGTPKLYPYTGLCWDTSEDGLQDTWLPLLWHDF